MQNEEEEDDDDLEERYIKQLEIEQTNKRERREWEKNNRILRKKESDAKKVIVEQNKIVSRREKKKINNDPSLMFRQLKGQAGKAVPRPVRHYVLPSVKDEGEDMTAKQRWRNKKKREMMEEKLKCQNDPSLMYDRASRKAVPRPVERELKADWPLWLSKWGEKCGKCGKGFREGDTYGLHMPPGGKRRINFFTNERDREQFMKECKPYHETCFDSYFLRGGEYKFSREERTARCVTWNILDSTPCQFRYDEDGGDNDDCLKVVGKQRGGDGWYPRDLYLPPHDTQGLKLSCGPCFRRRKTGII